MRDTAGRRSRVYEPHSYCIPVPAFRASRRARLPRGRARAGGRGRRVGTSCRRSAAHAGEPSGCRQHDDERDARLETDRSQVPPLQERRARRDDDASPAHVPQPPLQPHLPLRRPRPEQARQVVRRDSPGPHPALRGDHRRARIDRASRRQRERPRGRPARHDRRRVERPRPDDLHAPLAALQRAGAGLRADRPAPSAPRTSPPPRTSAGSSAPRSRRRTSTARRSPRRTLSARWWPWATILPRRPLRTTRPLRTIPRPPTTHRLRPRTTSRRRAR